jgi:hypothetical protein
MNPRLSEVNLITFGNKSPIHERVCRPDVGDEEDRVFPFLSRGGQRGWGRRGDEEEKT